MSSFYSIQVARLLQPAQVGFFGTSRAYFLSYLCSSVFICG